MSAMKVIIVVLIIIIIVIAVLLITLISNYNKLVRSRNGVEEAFATMDVYMKKRFDLIPNLVETVKGAAAHEKDTLDMVIRARNAVHEAQDSKDRAGRMEGEQALSGALKSVFALAESYPDLKANASFAGLQKQLEGVEEDISKARRFYNASVKEYNNKCETFPGSLFARLFRFERMEMYSVGSLAERETVDVKF